MARDREKNGGQIEQVLSTNTRWIFYRFFRFNKITHMKLEFKLTNQMVVSKAHTIENRRGRKRELEAHLRTNLDLLVFPYEQRIESHTQMCANANVFDTKISSIFVCN